MTFNEIVHISVLKTSLGDKSIIEVIIGAIAIIVSALCAILMRNNAKLKEQNKNKSEKIENQNKIIKNVENGKKIEADIDSYNTNDITEQLRKYTTDS